MALTNSPTIRQNLFAKNQRVAFEVHNMPLVPLRQSHSLHNRQSFTNNQVHSNKTFRVYHTEGNVRISNQDSYVRPIRMDGYIRVNFQPTKTRGKPPQPSA
ncbi:hypothetical protein CJ030_MR8G026775 [Morella rubra]|uniref:Uncharacterized protein n=1 Tax=Morella rubra TaxID=262757 RepID=A0A6A1USR1_9ROSI|nr:hypothetical protein CJ030_MR8G026775 [Morella rubra]